MKSVVVHNDWLHLCCRRAETDPSCRCQGQIRHHRHYQCLHLPMQMFVPATCARHRLRSDKRTHCRTIPTHPSTYKYLKISKEYRNRPSGCTTPLISVEVLYSLCPHRDNLAEPWRLLSFPEARVYNYCNTD